ncbi:hypothetical protein NVP1216O_60 [Vibrio phage 1.216.O._10N.222.55.C12]|nr:hypothetical protein NVP1213O_62 [Vibrio phage 1.213.O._10N.222.54.F10]AUR96188.1 hypothetical protein NVP1216O_60 [Vibrio phage 1.216.O._10N.222.55.C12]AUS00555.1 hypothetical protein NVP1276O_62 [Vibrio phage 1.276.O._10N.286.54.E4]
MNNVFRMPKLHRNSDAMAMHKKNLKRFGYTFYNSQRVRVVIEQSKFDNPYVVLAVEPV